MRGYCPNCGQHIVALCDESPGLTHQERAIIENGEMIKKLERRIRILENEKKKIQQN